MEKFFYLFWSITLSSGRNIISKKTAVSANGRAPFFFSQTLLFGAAALLFLMIGIPELLSVSAITLFYGILYGVLLILSQWMLMIALKWGNTSICTVIYSLGFLLPTISGALFWKEPFTVLNFCGVIIAVFVILLTAKTRQRHASGKQAYLPFILVAMISSGGLGIMQKLQQSSSAADEKGVFLLIAFSFAFFCSFVAFLLCRDKVSIQATTIVYPALIGLCFGGANLCNTILAGKMKSAIFFPIQNVSTILLTTVLGILICKEKITSRTVTIILLGIMVILLFSI